MESMAIYVAVVLSALAIIAAALKADWALIGSRSGKMERKKASVTDKARFRPEHCYNDCVRYHGNSGNFPCGTACGLER